MAGVKIGRTTTLDGVGGVIDIKSDDSSVDIVATTGSVDLSVVRPGGRIHLGPVNTHPSGSVGIYQQTSATSDTDICRTVAHKGVFGGDGSTKTFRVNANTATAALEGQVRLQVTPVGGGATTTLSTLAIDTDGSFDFFSADITSAVNALDDDEYFWDVDFKVTVADASNVIQVKEMHIEYRY